MKLSFKITDFKHNKTGMLELVHTLIIVNFISPGNQTDIIPQFGCRCQRMDRIKN